MKDNLSVLFGLIFIFSLSSTCRPVNDNKANLNKGSAGTEEVKSEKLSEEEKIPGLRKVEELSPYSGESKIYTSLEEAAQNPTEVYRLRLISQRLNTLPSKVLDFPNLEELYLSDNNLSNLPANFAQKLPRLQVIDLSNNQLQTLPKQVTELVDLEYLNISNNPFNNLPAGFANLKKLQVLSISTIRPILLPNEVFELKNLKYLSIKGFRINSLTNLISLNQLTRLALENTGLKTFPAEILGLRNLERLVLTNNQISKLPSQINNLRNLVYLNLSANRLNNEISSLSQLPNLVNLDISRNPIMEIPSDLFVKLGNLKALNLAYTAIKEVPVSIGQNKKLVWLALNGTKISHLPSAMQDCKRLQSLHLGNNPSLDLTETFILLSTLPKLSTLSLINLKGNRGAIQLPKEIINLKHLRKLDLKANRFANPSDELAKLSKVPNLEAVNLSLCGIRQAYPEFENLRTLQLLGLDIQNMPHGEVQKLPNLLIAKANIVDGSEFFDYR